MRNTVQRKIILDVVQKMHCHPTAEDVYQVIQREHPTISKSTVYRNLHQLADDREIRNVQLPDSPERFDDRLSQHYHFSCKECGRVFDVDMAYLSNMDETVQSAYGFEVDKHEVFFKGICSDCRRGL